MTQVRIIKTVTSTYEALEKTICDLCGAETPGESWKLGHGESKFIQISLDEKWDSGYADTGGSVKRTVFDVCPACWENKVMPWFASQGAQPRIEESDW